MTQARQIEKLTQQVASLRERLSQRTTQVVLLLGQIEDIKQQLADHGLEIAPCATDESTGPCPSACEATAASARCGLS